MSDDDFDYEADEARYMADDADDNEPGLCHSCSGSGEGQHEDSTCGTCKGKGEA